MAKGQWLPVVEDVNLIMLSSSLKFCQAGLIYDFYFLVPSFSLMASRYIYNGRIQYHYKMLAM